MALAATMAIPRAFEMARLTQARLAVVKSSDCTSDAWQAGPRSEAARLSSGAGKLRVMRERYGRKGAIKSESRESMMGSNSVTEMHVDDGLEHVSAT